MRALHFMKIDYILTRKQLYVVPLFFVLAAMVGVGTGEGRAEVSLLVASTYMLFVSSVFSTAPFGMCTGKNQGFLLLLPATVKERVLGRFLYGISFIGMLTLFCGALTVGYRLFGYDVPLFVLPILLCEMAISIGLTALEFLFFYLFGEGKENWQYLCNLVRTVPGMALFFGGSYYIGEMQDGNFFDKGMELSALTQRLIPVGITALVSSLVLMAVAAAVCVKAVERRDYA